MNLKIFDQRWNKCDVFLLIFYYLIYIFFAFAFAFDRC